MLFQIKIQAVHKMVYGDCLEIVILYLLNLEQLKIIYFQNFKSAYFSIENKDLSHNVIKTLMLSIFTQGGCLLRQTPVQQNRKVLTQHLPPDFRGWFDMIGYTGKCVQVPFLCRMILVYTKTVRWNYKILSSSILYYEQISQLSHNDN